MNELTRDDKVDRIKSLIGIVRCLYAKRLPDDFNVTIKIRNRLFKRMEIQGVHDEQTIVETNVTVRL
jgi:hypothetical protein